MEIKLWSATVGLAVSTVITLLLHCCLMGFLHDVVFNFFAQNVLTFTFINRLTVLHAWTSVFLFVVLVVHALSYLQIFFVSNFNTSYLQLWERYYSQPPSNSGTVQRTCRAATPHKPPINSLQESHVLPVQLRFLCLCSTPVKTSDFHTAGEIKTFHFSPG